MGFNMSVQRDRVSRLNGILYVGINGANLCGSADTEHMNILNERLSSFYQTIYLSD